MACRPAWGDVVGGYFVPVFCACRLAPRGPSHPLLPQPSLCLPLHGPWNPCVSGRRAETGGHRSIRVYLEVELQRQAFVYGLANAWCASLHPTHMAQLHLCHLFPLPVGNGELSRPPLGSGILLIGPLFCCTAAPLQERMQRATMQDGTTRYLS